MRRRMRRVREREGVLTARPYRFQCSKLRPAAKVAAAQSIPAAASHGNTRQSRSKVWRAGFWDRHQLRGMTGAIIELIVPGQTCTLGADAFIAERPIVGSRAFKSRKALYRVPR